MIPEDIKSLTETVKLVGEMVATKPNEWLPVYAALGGAVAGAIASFFPTWLLERRRDSNFSTQVRNCLLAEISALLEIIEHRGYLTSIREAVEHLKSQPEGTTYHFTVDVPQHYSKIYQENCCNIGVVQNNVAQKIVVFHQLIDAIVQDVKPGGIVSSGAPIEAYEELENIFSRAIEIGHEILKTHNKSFQRIAYGAR